MSFSLTKLINLANLRKFKVSNRTFFVGGAPRSGTGMLYALICSSMQAHEALHDCHYLNAQLSVYDSWRNGLFGDGFSGDGFIEDYFGHRHAYDEFTSEILGNILQHTRKVQGISGNLILKCPQLTPSFPDLCQLLDEAKFIVICRHPYDNLASMRTVARRQEEAGNMTDFVKINQSLEKLAGFLEGFYKKTYDFFEQKEFADRILFVKYEDVVQNTTDVLAALSEFTGMSFDNYNPAAPWKSKIDYAARFSSPNLFAYATPLYGSPLSAERIGSFKSVFDDEEQKQFQSLDIKNFHRFGYTR